MKSNENLQELKKILKELEHIRDCALAGKAPKWCDANGNPTEYYDYEMSNAAINDIYEVTHSLKVLIDKIEKVENVNENPVEEIDNMSGEERMRRMMVAAKQQMLLYKATHEHKPRCNKCVYETTCSKDKDSNNTCPDYKRDAPDGGYYG